MQTLESMRGRISTAEDLRAVVRVMKALAAVSIRQYERAVESLAEYNRTVEMGLQVLLRTRPEETASPRIPSALGLGVIVLGTDQGMCGSFNEQVASYARERISRLSLLPEHRVVLAVGARVAARLEDTGLVVRRCLETPGSVPGLTPVVQELLLEVEELRFRGGIDHILVFHNRPFAGAVSRPHESQVLPVDPHWLAELRAKDWPSRSLPTFSMDWRRLFSSLIRQHLFVSLYRPLAESLASENASRLASMQAAEKNIEDHLVQLRAGYHRQRQQAVTEELLDIVAGFETLATEEPENR
jgi:F-type H+-transporting ATPase subunit gamma